MKNVVASVALLAVMSAGAAFAADTLTTPAPVSLPSAVGSAVEGAVKQDVTAKKEEIQKGVEAKKEAHVEKLNAKISKTNETIEKKQAHVKALQDKVNATTPQSAVGDAIKAAQ